MATRPQAIPAESPPSADEREYIASHWKLVWWRFIRHRLAIVATVVIVLFYFIAIFAEFLTIHDPHKFSADRPFLGPQRVHLFRGFRPVRPYVYGIIESRDPVTLKNLYAADESVRYPLGLFVKGSEYKLFRLFPTSRHLIGLKAGSPTELQTLYILGTDKLGRDVYSRLMHGTRLSMSIGLVGVLISLILGVTLGGISGYRGGVVDVLIQRLIEFVRSIPTIPLWLALASAVPLDWSVIKIYFAITIIISLIGWTTLAREVRGRFLSMREEDFVVAARLYGSGELRVIFRHMLPSFTSHIIATTTLAVPAIIIAETSLSFLGLGLRPPAISWGTMLFEAQNLNAVANAPWLMLPGSFVLVAVLAFNFMGDGLRDAADPYSVQR